MGIRNREGSSCIGIGSTDCSSPVVVDSTGSLHPVVVGPYPGIPDNRTEHTGCSDRIPLLVVVVVVVGYWDRIPLLVVVVVVGDC